MEPNQPVSLVNNQKTGGFPQAVDPYYGDEGAGGTSRKIIFIILGIVGFIAFVAAVVFLLSKIFSSGKSSDGTLTYWGIWEDQAVMQPIIEDFERDHPGIKIKYEKQDIKGLGKYVERLKTRIDKGDGPDIYRFHSSWTMQLKNHLLAFPRDLVESTELDKDYYKTVQNDLKLNGVYYGIPLGVDTLALFVNTQLLANVGMIPPRQWDDITRSGAPTPLVKEGNTIITSSIALGTYDNIAHAPDILAMLFLQNGADLENLSGSQKRNAEDTLRFYQLFASGPTSTWNSTLDNSKLAFAKGNLAMYFGYSWDIFEIKALSPNLDFQVVPVPGLQDIKKTVASYWVEGVSSKTKHSEGAFEFMKFISKPETLQKLYAEQSKIRLFGSLYPRRSMQKLLIDNKLVFPFVQQADDARSTFFSSDTHDGDTGMISKMNIYLGNAVRSISETTSPESAIETLAKGINQIQSSYK